MPERIVRFHWHGQEEYGLIVDDAVHSLPFGPWGPRPLAAGPAVARLDEVELLAPCEPTKIVAVGLNYAAHAAEAHHDIPAEPVIFIKPPTTVVGPGAAVVYPRAMSQRVEYEAELALVIGRTARHVSGDEARHAVLGYTCGNDVTARDLQRRDGQWTRSKSFDTFCPLGPWIVADLDVTDLAVSCRVNGELRQAGRTGDMIFRVEDLVAFVSAVMTLHPGDVILTGTPAGVGPLLPGDRVAVEIEGIGRLENVIVREAG